MALQIGIDIVVGEMYRIRIYVKDTTYLFGCVDHNTLWMLSCICDQLELIYDWEMLPL